MIRRRTRIAAFISAVVVLISGCSHGIELKEISADSIPEEYKASLNSIYRDDLVPGSVVWRVYKDFGDYMLVACTFEVFARDGKKEPGFHVWGCGTTTEWMSRLGSGSGKIPRFGARISYQRSATARINHIDVGGIALDKRIVKVRVVTRSGSTAETEPFDGFWVIPFGISVDQDYVTEVQALDNNGNLLYRQDTWHLPW